MFKNETKNAMMAFAVVAMFMLSACAVMLSGNDAAENDGQTFTINMKVGDTFTYTPSANLGSGEGNGTTTFAWAKTSGADLITGATTFTPASGVNGTTFTFTPAAAGDMTVTLTATWNGPGSLSQTATQILAFHVVSKIVITGAQVSPADSASAASASASVGLVAGFTSAQSYSFAVTGGDSSNAAVFGATTSITKDDVADSTVTVSGNNTASLTVTVPASATDGIYVVTVPASFTIAGTSGSSTTATQTKVLTFTITIDEGMIISTNGPLYTIIGDNGTKTHEFEMGQTTNVTTSSLAYTIDATADNGWATNGDGIAYVETTNALSGDGTTTATLTLPTSGYDNADLGADVQCATVAFTLTATANTASQPVTVSKNYTLNVYRTLAFTTVPVLDNNSIVTYSSSVNGLDVLMTTNVAGAKKITYVWGDGTTTVKDNSSASANYFTANHTYAREGTYFIQVTASNDFGEKTVITPYTTGASIIMDADKTLKMTGIKETVDAEANTIVLDPTVIVTAGYAVAYKWTYSIDGAEAVELTAAGTPAWFKAFGGADHKSITISTAQADELPANVKFTCEASVTFEGDEKATTSSASYTYQDSHFMAQNGWIVWVALAALIVGIVLIVFVTGPIMPVNIFTAAAAVITVILFLAKMYMWF